MQSEDTTAPTHAPDAWPGPAASTTLRAQWHRAHQRIAELEKVGRAVAHDLERARAEVRRIEDLARRAKAAEAPR